MAHSRCRAPPLTAALATAGPPPTPPLSLIADGSGPLARALGAVPGARLWCCDQHPHRLSAHRHTLPGGHIRLRPRAVEHLAGPSAHRLCPAGGRDETRRGAEAAQCCHPLTAPLPSVQWGGGTGLGSRGADPTPVDACHAPLSLDGRGGGTSSRHLSRQQSQGPAESRDPAAPGPPRRPGA
jgi:hypothetical protein